MRAYNTLFSDPGKVFKDEGNGLDRTSFSKGYALYAFDMTPDLAEDDHFNLMKQGSVRLVLKLSEALNENLTVIDYAEFQNVVRDRQESQRDLRLCGMNTYKLERAIGEYMKRFGVFASDRLPTKPRLLVCNTDPSNMPGEHWITIYVDDDGHYGEYFDSLERAPGAPNRLFEHYMNEHCREWTYNWKQLQSITSSFCGHYSVCYCILRSRGIDMRRFLRYFTRDTGLNDVIVHEIICSLMNVK